MKDRLTFIIVFIIAIGVILLFNFLQQKKPSQQSLENENPNQNIEVKKEPKFYLGTVIEITGDAVTFDAGQDGKKTATVNDGTKLVKQVKDKKGLLSKVPASFSDIKTGGHIIMYYEAEPDGSSYSATKLHIAD